MNETTPDNPYRPPLACPSNDVERLRELPTEQMIARRFRIFVECVFVVICVWTQLVVTLLPSGGFRTEELVGFHSLAASGPFAIVILIWEFRSTERRQQPRDSLLARILIWLTVVPLGMGMYWLYDFIEGGYRDSLGCGILVLLFAPFWFFAARARRVQSQVAAR